MGVIDTLLANNRAHAAGFSGAGLPMKPGKRLAIVACMDARLDVRAALGLDPGEAHVLRNAGGVVTDDVIRSLAISQRQLGTREVMVIQHTDCGMTTVTDAELKEQIREETGIRPPFAMETFLDIEDEVRQSIARIEASPFLPHKDAVRGFVYEVETGRIREVNRAGDAGGPRESEGVQR